MMTECPCIINIHYSNTPQYSDFSMISYGAMLNGAVSYSPNILIRRTNIQIYSYASDI